MARNASAPKGQTNGADAYVALLRGINVGGKNLVPMKDLVVMFTEAGCLDVTTYIQSGNVLFKASPKLAGKLPSLIAKRISEAFEIRIPVVLRSRDELARVARSNPFIAPGVDTDKIQVMFLADAPSPEKIAALDANRSPPDEFVVKGREIYMKCPNGFARTKLTNAYFDSKLATTSTGRNWRTVLKLLELSSK